MKGVSGACTTARSSARSPPKLGREKSDRIRSGLIPMQGRDEFRLRLDPIDDAIETRFGQIPGQQLGIGHAVFDDHQL